MPSDAETMYYVRSRGRVSGPFTLADLARQVSRGLVGRAHQVSADRVNWTAVTDVPQLFDASAGGTPLPTSGLTMVPAGERPSSGEPGGFNYAIGSETFGPMPLALLQSLAQNGRLPADALIWEQGDTVSCPAAQHPLLSQIDWTLAGVAGGAVQAKSGEPTGGGKAIGPAKQSGCGIMLLVAALLALAGGVWLAIWMTDSKVEEPKPAPPAAPKVMPVGPGEPPPAPKPPGAK